MNNKCVHHKRIFEENYTSENNTVMQCAFEWYVHKLDIATNFNNKSSHTVFFLLIEP